MSKNCNKIICYFLDNFGPFFRSFLFWIFLLGIGFLFTWTFGVNLYDETWFLQVIRRLKEGEILYRDVFFGVNPISAYVTLFFSLFFGTEILVLKFLQALCFASTVFLTVRISRLFLPEKKWPWLVIGFLFVYSPPYPNSLYSPLGMVFFIATLYSALKWIQITKSQVFSERSRGWLIWSGVFAGLTFGVKQNYGILALLALAGVFLFASVPRAHSKMRCTWIGIVSGAFFMVVLLTVVLPVVLTHSEEAYWEYAFMRKVNYIRHSQIPYFRNFQPLFNWMRPSFFSYVKTAYGLLFFLFPFAILPLLLGFLLWRPRDQKPEFLVLLFFGMASIFSAYPRFDSIHVVYSVPAMLIGGEVIWIGLRTLLNPFLRRVISWALVVWLSPGIILSIRRPIKLAFTGGYAFSTLPHFRYALFNTKEYVELKDHIQDLKKNLPSNEAFLLGAGPGIYYLTCGIHNPTPMDYPLGLSKRELDKIKKEIQTGEILTVVLLYPLDYCNAPISLIEEVKTSMHKIKQLDFGEMYVY